MLPFSTWTPALIEPKEDPRMAPQKAAPQDQVETMVAEARVAQRTVAYDGETYTLPANMEDWDGDVLLMLHRGDLYGAVEMLIGAEQVDRFRLKKRTIREWNELTQALMGNS